MTPHDALVLETLHSQILAACVHWTFMIGESAHQLGATISGGTRENVEAQCNAVSSSHISRISWALCAKQPALVTIVEFPYLTLLLEYCRWKELRFSWRVLWKKLKAAPIKTVSGDQMHAKLAIEYLEPFFGTSKQSIHINTINTSWKHTKIKLFHTFPVDTQWFKILQGRKLARNWFRGIDG